MYNLEVGVYRRQELSGWEGSTKVHVITQVDRKDTMKGDLET